MENSGGGILAIAFAAVSFALRLGDLGTEVYLITLALLLIVYEPASDRPAVAA